MHLTEKEEGRVRQVARDLLTTLPTSWVRVVPPSAVSRPNTLSAAGVCVRRLRRIRDKTRDGSQGFVQHTLIE
jgi:hypothetical protein